MSTTERTGMPSRLPLSPLEVGILIFMSDEAVRRRGWLLRGVRGWRHYVEIKARQDAYIAEKLPHMARRGLLNRADVVEFGRTRPTMLYRISQEGERQLAQLVDRPPERMPEPGAEDGGGNLFVPSSTWSALTAMQRCALERIGPERFGAHGWMTMREIGAGQPTVLHEDLTWLVRRGLAELRSGPGTAGGKPRTFYRLTAPGLRVVLVDAVPSPSGRVELVEARVPEEAGPTPA
ncbi:MAG: hypothetical protein AB1941_18760 [Gemmatimonadota bacterium]